MESSSSGDRPRRNSDGRGRAPLLARSSDFNVVPSRADGSVVARLGRAQARGRGLFKRVDERLFARFGRPAVRRLKGGPHPRRFLGQVLGDVLQLAASVAARLWSGQESHSGTGRGACQEGQNDSSCVIANGFTHDYTTPPLFASFRTGTAMSVGPLAAPIGTKHSRRSKRKLAQTMPAHSGRRHSRRV